MDGLLQPSAILRLNNAKLVGLEWVWGLLQPGFVRWAPRLHKTTLTTGWTVSLAQVCRCDVLLGYKLQMGKNPNQQELTETETTFCQELNRTEPKCHERFLLGSVTEWNLRYIDTVTRFTVSQQTQYFTLLRLTKFTY